MYHIIDVEIYIVYRGNVIYFSGILNVLLPFFSLQPQDGASVRIIMSPPQQRFEWMMIAGAFVFISSETVNLA